MVRKMEMAREMEIGREMENGETVKVEGMEIERKEMNRRIKGSYPASIYSIDAAMYPACVNECLERQPSRY